MAATAFLQHEPYLFFTEAASNGSFLVGMLTSHPLSLRLIIFTGM